jgi:hypothetical protein
MAAKQPAIPPPITNTSVEMRFSKSIISTCDFIMFVLYFIIRFMPTGGLVFGGGGFFMPTLKYSPVSLRFHPIR